MSAPLLRCAAQFLAAPLGASAAPATITATGRTYKSPAFYAFKLYSTRCRGQAVATWVDCGTFDSGDGYRNIPYLDSPDLT